MNNTAHKGNPASVTNVYSVRRARRSDALVMASLERDAFPELERPTRFRRELRREDAAYLVATRPAIGGEQEIAKRSRRFRGIGSVAAYPVDVALDAVELLLFQKIGLFARAHPGEHVGGFVGVWFVLDEAHVTTIASRPAERRQGIGELLLIASLELAMRHVSRTVTLEVRASNGAARSLYRKYGFQDVGVRKRYYSDGEDAIIMTTPDVLSSEYWSFFRILTDKYSARWGESLRFLA